MLSFVAALDVVHQLEMLYVKLEGCIVLQHCDLTQLPVMQGPDEVFEATAQALLAGVDRDSLAGWGAIVYLITPEGVTAKTLKGRMD